MVKVHGFNPNYYLMWKIEEGPVRIKSVDPNKSLFDCNLDEINFLIRKQQIKIARIEGKELWDYRPKKQRKYEFTEEIKNSLPYLKTAKRP